ncbi:deoxynucleoside kinase [Solibacillus sp. FSL H8-0523]|uniref:deoxynucleoside kinase n=1 Tax=unclassified Solibacillus TaxID=2637870 RepID=UPI003100EA71
MNLREKYNIPANAVITIAGTVGVGKSTMTKALADALKFRTSYEKVDTNPYLDKFYDDFEKWSFHLQVYFLAERFKEQKRIFEYGGGFIQDRSIYEDTGIFAKMHFDKGTMTPTDYETYTNLFDAMVMTPYFPHPDLLVYLEGPIDDVIGRIQERGREMEQQTPHTYWEEMHGRYEEWINNFNACPVLRIDINDYDLMKNPDQVEDVVARIAYMLEQTSHLRK